MYVSNLLSVYKNRNELKLGGFFGFSLFLHICSAVLFTLYADRVMNRCHQEVFYIDLNQISVPCVSTTEKKTGPAMVKHQANLPPNAEPLKREQNAQPVKATAQPMQQTVAGETAKTTPIMDTSPVFAPAQGNPGIAAANSSGAQNRVSASSGASGGPSAGAAPAGDVDFGSASGPSFLQRILPSYPTVARRFNREGKVILRLTIDTVGALINVEILQDPGYGFAAAAVEAMKKSRFHPARHEGRPFTAKAILPIRFTLQGVN